MLDPLLSSVFSYYAQQDDHPEWAKELTINGITNKTHPSVQWFDSLAEAAAADAAAFIDKFFKEQQQKPVPPAPKVDRQSRGPEINSTSCQVKTRKVVSKLLSPLEPSNSLNTQIAHQPVEELLRSNGGVLQKLILENELEIINTQIQILRMQLVFGASSSRPAIPSAIPRYNQSKQEVVDPYGALKASPQESYFVVRKSNEQDARAQSHLSVEDLSKSQWLFDQRNRGALTEENLLHSNGGVLQSQVTTSKKKQKRDTFESSSVPEPKKSCNKKDVEKPSEGIVSDDKEKILDFIGRTVKNKVIRSILKLKVRYPLMELDVLCMEDQDKYDKVVKASALIVEKFPKLQGLFD